ncbi:WD40-repeat-containing domain protein [Schizophyllum commune]
MPKISQYELEREANIARNRALLAALELDNASKDLGFPAKPPPDAKKDTPKAKPVQPRKKRERKEETPAPRRQSTRLRTTIDPNESPSKKRKREADFEARRAKEEAERLEAEERAREAKRPRHQDLDLRTIVEDMEDGEMTALLAAMKLQSEDSKKQSPSKSKNSPSKSKNSPSKSKKSPSESPVKSESTTTGWRRAADPEAFVYSAAESKKEDTEVAALRESLQGLRIVSRAKVTQDRVYSVAYHPEKSKDLIFFGGEQLGIWDARAPTDEAADEDGEPSDPSTEEGGKYWRLQLHWPATAKSSISTIKIDPVNSQTIYTTSYDCTLRSLSFESGVSREVYTAEGGALLSSVDMPPAGNEMWISDAVGGVVHLDLREARGKARYFGLSNDKIGAVSVNPSRPNFLAAGSNDRTVRIWDTRQLTKDPRVLGPPDEELDTSADVERAWGYDAVTTYESESGRALMRGEWKHDKAVGSVYWDARGRSLVSTSYDDKLRVWDFKSSVFKTEGQFPSMRPLRVIPHNCQTGRWLTPLRARWTENPDVYPHFTVGNMHHSLDIFSAKGDLLARLEDKTKITAVQAVTCSHPSIVERAVSGNASGRCVLWAPSEDA